MQVRVIGNLLGSCPRDLGSSPKPANTNLFYSFILFEKCFFLQRLVYK